MASFLFFIMELLVAGAIGVGIYFKSTIDVSIAGGELYSVILLIVLGIIELVLIFTHIDRALKNKDAKSELSYTIGEPQGSYFWGFIIGFIFNILGLLITLIASKSNTKKGALIGLIVMIALIVFTYLGYSILKA